MSDTEVPFDRSFNAAVLHIANRLNPRGWDVSASAPETYEALRLHVERYGRIAVWSGGSDHTIFGDAEVNYAFRAWHDWCHLIGRHDFSMAGERKVAEMQKRHLLTLYGEEASRTMRLLIDIEVVGQAEYHEKHGNFPADQRAFTRDFILREMSL